MRARREPLWGQFLIREGFSARALHRGLGLRLLRDIQKGIDAKRFSVADPLMSFLSVSGALLTSIAAELQFAASLKELGFDSNNLPERAAGILLQTLGLGRAEADRIARRPLLAADLETADGPNVPVAPTFRSGQSGASRRKRSKGRVPTA
jgi:hypothetical protein